MISHVVQGHSLLATEWPTEPSSRVLFSSIQKTNFENYKLMKCLNKKLKNVAWLPPLSLAPPTSRSQRDQC